ncbi:MAG: hypothetical protein LBK68_01590 [Candidatus Margulisbacteria bacterium]|jgi:hypothetical protein|nr:hypothetical protein [Candidatus Margulisiibacteriota bacterium]
MSYLLSYLLYALFFLLAYILQTTWLADWPARPELLLLVVCLGLSGRAYGGLLAGLLTGVFLDLANGYGFYNAALYGLLGLLCGFMPVSIFRDFRSLVFVNMLLGSLLLHGGYAALAKIFLGRFIFVPLPQYILTLLLNLLFFWLLQFFIKGKYHIYD